MAASTPPRDPRDPPADAALAAAADTPLGAHAPGTPPADPAAEPTGHDRPGDSDATPVGGAAPEHRAAFHRWREQELQAMEADYAAWCATGETRFPDDFDAWRRRHRIPLRATHSPAGLPLAEATEDAPESEKAALLFERS